MPPHDLITFASSPLPSGLRVRPHTFADRRSFATVASQAFRNLVVVPTYPSWAHFSLYALLDRG